MEQDEKLSKLSSINEVEALRSVFYKLFEAKQSEQDSVNNKNVLISMNLPEMQFNPFFDYEKDEGRFTRVDDSQANIMFAT
mmetsp:Transcript_11164/g.13178  ORF Transcript_11164/g.13178 Transcript_11164/m.13178 type:complete len:81 (+) Transcript_11164:1698-1940(+)|eukprot:CAMPEP_0170468536 /NCGR_PEP_ID=MMETSP0123-20130129/11679_1 /TAXON_ID=182087 /ORGANISM="Favella ehrenbergii, Strain Fehren 1" /LENGTH=80 /DNA_ID=CAMNT_0010735129 /DNA_START=1632 /DNA_END=1874 /DNA_ORIENTATION=-